MRNKIRIKGIKKLAKLKEDNALDGHKDGNRGGKMPMPTPQTKKIILRAIWNGQKKRLCGN